MERDGGMVKKTDGAVRVCAAQKCQDTSPPSLPIFSEHSATIFIVIY